VYYDDCIAPLIEQVLQEVDKVQPISKVSEIPSNLPRKNQNQQNNSKNLSSKKNYSFFNLLNNLQTQTNTIPSEEITDKENTTYDSKTADTILSNNS